MLKNIETRIILLTILLTIGLSLFISSSRIAPLSANQINLTGIRFDSLRVGDSIYDADLSKYTPSDRFLNAENQVSFEELRITYDKAGIIKKIHANIGEVAIVSLLPGRNPIQIERTTNIRDVMSVFGMEHPAVWYDREQRLKQVIYHDASNRLLMRFVFSVDSNNLVWVIMEAIN